MQIALVGLGKMGMPLAQNIMRHHELVTYDINENLLAEAGELGISTQSTLTNLVAQLRGQKIIWLMVPAGKITDSVIENLSPLLSAGDIIIDGGNSHYTDSIRRAEQLDKQGISLLDCGSSGGVSGARNGLCAMVGGNAEAFEICKPLFHSISLPNGYLYCGKSGSGHFVKMVHNGIEYGMMQSIAEGFDLLHQSDFSLSLPAVAKLYDTGSVIRGWLMELTARAFEKQPTLAHIKGVAHASGEAQWMVDAAEKMNVAVPATRVALDARYQSQQQPNFSAKVVAALRSEFGGHATVPSD